MRPPALVVTLAVFLAPALATTANPVDASAAAASPESSYSATAVKATNNARAAHGRKALRPHKCLHSFARRHAERMAAEESMYHQELGPIMEACGLSTVGENVAYGYPTGRAVVRRGWMNSEGHRANILNPAYRLVAVAGARSDDGTWYAAQVFGRKA